PSLLAHGVVSARLIEAMPRTAATVMQAATKVGARDGMLHSEILFIDQAFNRLALFEPVTTPRKSIIFS
ncbi:hypothetical protein MOV61_27410, partial [Neorhizobium sp. BETTINA12A]|uniref:hypothetical protein n=1 Tax=Neorhizobium sp. BETTINA12A TaxID=2908924 RepID=UPI001FF1F1DF